MAEYPPAIIKLINQFKTLPGVGPKAAERFVLSLLKKPKNHLQEWVFNFEKIKAEISCCQECNLLIGHSQAQTCQICLDPQRQSDLICVVAEIPDLQVIENSLSYRGKYHLTGGLIKPLYGQTAETLNFAKLMQRLEKGTIREVILAFNPDQAGETTALYLARQIKPLNIKITRLARGLPSGSAIEYADKLTMKSALQGRQEF